MAKQEENKKENPLVGGIILLVCSIIAIALGADYVWVLFGAIEIPLQIVGIVGAIISILFIIAGVKAKKQDSE